MKFKFNDSAVIIIGLILVLLFVGVISHRAQMRDKTFTEKVNLLKQEFDTIFIPRISYCSVREFPGTMALGLESSEYTVALSEDLFAKYKGWQVAIPKVSPKLFLIADKPHKRFRNTIDIYSYLPAEKLLKLGVIQDTVTFISPKGMKLLGEFGGK